MKRNKLQVWISQAQNNTLRINYIKAKIEYMQQNSKCR